MTFEIWTDVQKAILLYCIAGVLIMIAAVGMIDFLTCNCTPWWLFP
jgi:hypothetical protein